MTPEKQPFIVHLKELRIRLMYSIFALITGTILGYFIYKPLLYLLTRPLGQQLYYTSPAGGFNFILKICLFFGALVSIPVFLYNAARFIQPVIPDKSKHIVTYTLIFSFILMITGNIFAYFISLPAALHFLNKFGSGEVKSLISTNEYFSFVVGYLIGFSLIFQLPLIFIFLHAVFNFKTVSLLKFQRIVILTSFIIGAVLTPTADIFNMLIMTIPVILLYYFSVILVWVREKRKQKISGNT